MCVDDMEFVFKSKEKLVRIYSSATDINTFKHSLHKQDCTLSTYPALQFIMFLKTLCQTKELRILLKDLILTKHIVLCTKSVL